MKRVYMERLIHWMNKKNRKPLMLWGASTKPTSFMFPAGKISELTIHPHELLRISDQPQPDSLPADLFFL